MFNLLLFYTVSLLNWPCGQSLFYNMILQEGMSVNL